MLHMMLSRLDWRVALRKACEPEGRAAPALLVLVAGFALGGPVLWRAFDTRPSGDGVTAASIAQIPRRQTAAADSIDVSRRTAIVRAAERVAPAVVSVNVLRRETVRPRTYFDNFLFGPYSRESQGLGSGFIIDAIGLVLTNEHVVRGATEIVVTLGDGRDFRAEIVGVDDVTDIALLRLVEPRPANLPIAPIGSSADLVTGEWAIAIGNPFGNLLSNAEPTVTAGVISGVGRNIIPTGEGRGGYYLDMIQTDAAINPGNSGGALVNALGEVIGVNSSIITESGGSVGLGFAIPIDRALRIADGLRREGRVRRVWVGVEVRPSEPNSFGRSNRVEVVSVVPGSPAQRAGLRAGTVIEAVNGRAVRSPLDYEARLLDTRVGESLEMTVLDGSDRRRIRLAAQDLPSLTAERVSAVADFRFITVTPAIQAERGMASEEGALIDGLSDDARALGLREGDVVREINRSRVRNAQDAAAMLRRLANSGTAVRMSIERRGQLLSASFRIRT
jgi:serine protease Do